MRNASGNATWEEPERSGSPQRRAHVAHVLCFDDLTKDIARVLPWGGQPADLTLGRAPADGPGAQDMGTYWVDDRFASGRHTGIRRSGADRAGPVDLIEDLGSRNGTFLNGEPVTSPTRLLDQDVIEVGHSAFVYIVTDPIDAARLDAPGPTLGPTRSLSPSILRIACDLEDLSAARDPILVLGETGSGKEAVATAIHEWSGRPGALRAVDCGAIPDGLFEATLFGHRKGAFTGADEARVGEIVRAHRGTLFLDEVGNLSKAGQAKLLRVMETGVVPPLGGGTAEKVDVRWIAATNHAVFEDAAEFRDDLLQRLAGYVARLPPLRRRRQDLGILVAHFLRELGASRCAMTPLAARALLTHRWPGNIRQLRATLRTASMLARSEPIDLRHLSLGSGVDGPGDGPDPSARGGSPTPKRRAAPDAGAITQALTDSRGSVVRAAAALGVQPRQLYRYIERFGIAMDGFRERD